MNASALAGMRVAGFQEFSNSRSCRLDNMGRVAILIIKEATMIAYEIIRCDYCDFESARNAYSEKSLGLFASAEAAQGFLNTIPVTQLTPYLASGGYGKEVYPKFKVKTHMVYD